MTDYLIIGFGLAGMNLAHQLELNQQSFTVIDSDKRNASKIAGGINNPLILKRFTKAWKADEFIPKAEKTYQDIEHQLGIKAFYPTPIYRKIKSIGEQNNWFVAADKSDLSPFMNPQLQQLSTLHNPFSYGEVTQSSRLDTAHLIDIYRQQLIDKQQLFTEQFDYTQLSLSPSNVSYKAITARKIIFCEGYQLLQNPYFKTLPLIGNKGEYLIVKIPGLALDKIIKTALALIPLGHDLYKFGATYSRDFTTEQPEENAKAFLIKKLEELIARPYTIIAIKTGIRPTVKDRRPLLGSHPDYSRLLIFNGLGSHGVMIAPTAAEWLINYDLNHTALPKNVDVQRYLTSQNRK